MGMMINRRRAYGGKSLPYDAEIEYLKSTGTQYIDTGFVLNDDKYIISASFNIQGGDQFSAIFTNYSNSGNVYGFAILSSTQTWVNACNNANSGMKVQLSLNTDYNVTISKGTFIMNGSIYTTTSILSGYSKNKLHLFRQIYNNKIISAKIYRITIQHDGTLFADLIPVRVGQVGYMYDKVSGQLFGNSGTGSFILGPDK